MIKRSVPEFYISLLFVCILVYLMVSYTNIISNIAGNSICLPNNYELSFFKHTYQTNFEAKQIRETCCLNYTTHEDCCSSYVQIL